MVPLLPAAAGFAVPAVTYALFPCPTAAIAYPPGQAPPVGPQQRECDRRAKGVLAVLGIAGAAAAALPFAKPSLRAASVGIAVGAALFYVAVATQTPA